MAERQGEDSSYWIEALGLKPHPEGGFYRETYRAELTLQNLPEGFKGPRSASTGIYFLLRNNDFSALHRIPSDEMWHFYAGNPLVVHVLHPAGQREDVLLGSNPRAGEVPQAVVPAGCWFGSRLRSGEGFALVGCTVAPGFDFADFEMAGRDDLIHAFPQHRALIEQLTR